MSDTNFPTNLDTNPGNPSPSERLSQPPHSFLHGFAQDAIIAIETYIGKIGSSVTSSLTYLLTSTSSINPGHKHTSASVSLTIEQLTDVSVSSPTNGQGLLYNGSAWVNSTIATIVALLQGTGTDGSVVFDGATDHSFSIDKKVTIALPNQPTSNQTLTLIINGTSITITFVTSIGTTAGNVLIGINVAATLTNLFNLLQSPSTTNTTQVALSSPNQTLVGYFTWSASTTIVGIVNTTSFTSVSGTGQPTGCTVTAGVNNVYTILRDVFATSMSVSSGVTVNTNNFRIFFSGTLTNNGTIQNNGVSGANGGSATAAGSLPGTPAGGGGVAYPSTGGVGTGTTHAIGGNGGAGQSGNNSNSGGGSSGFASAGGIGGVVTASVSTFFFSTSALMMVDVSPSGIAMLQGGASGGGGGATSNGGGGGNGGGGAGIVFLSGSAVVNTGLISANGGVGGDGSNGGNASGGGGGGGGGGAVAIFTASYTNSGTVQANGGIGGMTGGFNSPSPGVTGNNGTVSVFVV